MNITNKIAAILIIVSISGCSSLTGFIDATDSFSCPMGKGSSCSSLSATYNELRAKEGHVMGVVSKSHRIQEVSKLSRSTTPCSSAQGKFSHIDNNITNLKRHELKNNFDERIVAKSKNDKEGRPDRTKEQTMFLCVLPWVDKEGDFHEVTRIWIQVAQSRWRIEKMRTKAISDLGEYVP